MKSSFSPLQTLFIYDRREMIVLIVLCATIGLFTFTLGIHLGKEVATHVESNGELNEKLVRTIPDQIPTSQELAGPNKTTQQALEDSINQSLHEEVVRTGIRLNPSLQTELPENAKTGNAGATTLKEQAAKANHTAD